MCPDLNQGILKGYKAERKGSYAVLGIFKSQEALEELFGTECKPGRGPPIFIELRIISQTDYLTGRRIKYYLRITGN
jgi:hypothetical protein